MVLVKNTAFSPGERVVQNNYEDKQWFAQKLRDALGAMPQADLLKLLEQNGHPLGQQRLSHLMQGRNYPDPIAFRELVRALGVSADWVLGLTKESLPVADLEEMLSQSKGEGRIDKIMRRLPKDKQEQVIAFAEFLLFYNSGDGTAPAQERIAPTGPKGDMDAAARAASNQRAASAVLAVMRRRMDQSEIDDVINEVLAVAPQLSDLIAQGRSVSKDAGMQGT